MAAAESRLVGILAGVVPVLAMACTVIGIGLFHVLTNPPTTEGPGMIIGFVLLLLPPAICLSVISWFGARVAIHVIRGARHTSRNDRLSVRSSD
jgi:hypothetical protein